MIFFSFQGFVGNKHWEVGRLNAHIGYFALKKGLIFRQFDIRNLIPGTYFEFLSKY